MDMESKEDDIRGKEMIYKSKNGIEYRINEKRKKGKLYICNCIYGHMNCECDGNGRKRQRTTEN